MKLRLFVATMSAFDKGSITKQLKILNPRDCQRIPSEEALTGGAPAPVLLPVYCPFPDCLERHCPTL